MHVRRRNIMGICPKVSKGCAPVDARLLAIRARAGFTLIETLVVVSIMGVLLSLLMPAIQSVRGSMKSLVCSSNMRSMSMDFSLFAEGNVPEGRGKSERLGRNRFWINDFLERQYRIDEFWDLGGANTGSLSTSDTMLLCPAGAPTLTRRRGFPCGSSAVGPVEDVSVAVNMRLYRAAVSFKGKTVLAPSVSSYVRSDILNHPYVPLLIDVDGEAASNRGIEPFYTAPPARTAKSVDDPYANGRYWIPSNRHNGATNVAFVGGHVLQSDRAADEHWDWSYQAATGR